MHTHFHAPLTRALVIGTAALAALAGSCTAAAPSFDTLQPATLPAAAGVTPGLPQYPSISPDGTLIVYSWAGDLWACPAKGGPSVRLTSHPARETRSAFSPDGSMLAFESDREGARNLYVAPLIRDGGTVSLGVIRRVTVSDRAQTLAAFLPGGDGLLFSANMDPAGYRGTMIYAAPLDGGPVRRLTEAWGGSPRVSADGKSLYFTRRRPEYMRPKYRGSAASDVWKLDLGTGQFTQLTFDAASDGDPMPTADGSVVYLSTRDGQINLWRLAANADDRANPTQLTRFAPEGGRATIGHGARDLDINTKGNTAVFCLWDTMYTLDLTRPGASPQPVRTTVSADSTELDSLRLNLSRDVSEHAISPDGKTLAVIARGEVFVRSTEEGRPTRRVTFTAGRERGLAWSPDNRVLYFSSDETGVSKLYYATVALSREDLEPPKPAKPEKADEGEKKDEPKPEAPKAEGEKGDKGEKKEGDTEKKDDAKPKIDYGKRWADSIRFDVKPLPIPDLPAGRNDGMFGPEDRSILPAPDGRKVLFVRGLGDVILLDLTKKEARRVLEGWNEPELQWASDSRHIVFAREDTDFNSDIWLMDTGESKAEPVNLTRHPDTDDSPKLSADGKVLYFRSERAGDNGDFDVWFVTLDRALDGLRPYELEEHFKKAADAAKKRKPIDAVVWDSADPVPAAKPRPALKFDGAADAYNRARRLTTFPGSEGNLAITPGGDRVLFSATPPPTDAPATPPAAGAAPAAPSRTLFNVSYKGDDRKTVTTGALSGVTVSLTGERVSWISGGGASWAPSGGGKTDALSIDAPVVIDVAAQQRQKFLEGARLLGNGFYHPTLKGLPWVKLTNEYLSLAERTRTSDEFDRVFMMLLNELDGSHLGINSPGGFSAASPATGYLGVDVQPVAGGYKVTRIINDSPADKEATRLFVGDVITAIDGRPLAAQGRPPSVDFIAALAGRAGKETLLELDRADKSRSKMLIIVPTSNGEDSTLRYRHEVARRREIVEKASGGRLGYLHIRGMDQASVLEFERDLYAAANGKDGLIIDVRDNGGGSTADILLSSLTAPRHAYTANRGVDVSSVPKDAYPRDRRLIYGYSRPINVLINENSYSNAEIFAHSIKTIGRGKLVGVATFGAVISTGAATLIDGATVRTPFRGWYLPDGTDMEVRGAQPDVPVGNTPADEAAGKDAQLETAVQELLGRVGK